MPTAHQLGFHLLELRLHPLSLRGPAEKETSGLRLPTNMGKAQEIERFRFSEIPLPASLGRITAELYQTRFLGMEIQAELRQSITKVPPEPLRLITMLKANHDVIGETNDDNIASRIPTTPLVRPKVENVV